MVINCEYIVGADTHGRYTYYYVCIDYPVNFLNMTLYEGSYSGD